MATCDAATAGGLGGTSPHARQMDMSGNKTLYAQIYVDTASSLSNMVINTSISGNPTITYNATLGGAGFTVTGWREFR
jgi:hypothetical protein